MRHDFTRSRWGHNMSAKMDGEVLKGFTWSSPQLKEGDEVRYETAYGWAVAKVTNCHQYRDPHDMARFEAVIVERELSEKSKQMIDNGEVDSAPWL